ncbi:hypothetical protein AWC38_SpisGene12174 [Stylophora pistillata]|uniref:Peptidase A2 domain-containing protein n=1 Tax=Stylophora pistillata TaxID=50429 RepID=A0A2B4S3Z9_STYPI|nr:hypothetical protein AWC38_SpisGene12174 [Stylophora pistillata]
MENMPVLPITPRETIKCMPIFVTFDPCGPGHYDAVEMPSSKCVQPSNKIPKRVIELNNDGDSCRCGQRGQKRKERYYFMRWFSNPYGKNNGERQRSNSITGTRKRRAPQMSSEIISGKDFMTKKPNPGINSQWTIFEELVLVQLIQLQFSENDTDVAAVHCQFNQLLDTKFVRQKTFQKITRKIKKRTRSAKPFSADRIFGQTVWRKWLGVANARSEALAEVQKVKVRGSDGTFSDLLAMLDTGSNTSLLSRAARQLGISGPQTHLTMNLAGGRKKAEISEIIEIKIGSSTDEDILKPLQVYTVRKPCSNAKTVSRKAVESYPHLKPIADKLHLSGGTVDLLIGKVNSDAEYMTEIRSIDVGTVSAIEDIEKLVHQDLLGVKPTEMCTCSENALRENRFVKALSASTTLENGRVQVKMPWKESGPPKQSNYGIALKRMYSAEKSFKKKDCFEIVDQEVQKLVDQGFVIKKGPNYINSLPNVLIAWRWDEVAYAGDIRKMFNQVLVHPDDQVFHRFLWRKNQHDLPTVYQWLRLNFGDKPAPQIASNAINILAKTSHDDFPEAAKELQERTYVDDIGGSRPTTAEAKQVTTAIDEVLAKGQFQIIARHSNCHPGLVATATLKFGIDLQELWRAGYGWDDILPEATQHKWKGNEEAINRLLTCKCDRKLKPTEAIGSPQVHGFADGGELGYGAVIFLRWKLRDGSHQCVPVIVKPFVASLKQGTIPRLERLGYLVLTRLYNTCQGR